MHSSLMVRILEGCILTSLDVLVKTDCGPAGLSIPVVSARNIHEELGFSQRINDSTLSLEKSLRTWKMEVDDAPIFRYIYRHWRPSRHLEFGTWQGMGVVYCLEECDATVWTINLAFGESAPDGGRVYGNYPAEVESVQKWAERIGFPRKDLYRTDSIGFIGRFYLDGDMGHRVCQIYSDSAKWDISQYPQGFFDSVLVDGGHGKETVLNDTRKALKLLRAGGLIMWHDFCPPIWEEFGSTRGVMEGIAEMWGHLSEETEKIFWVNPSWILMGVKKR